MYCVQTNGDILMETITFNHWYVDTDETDDIQKVIGSKLKVSQ